MTPTEPCASPIDPPATRLRLLGVPAWRRTPADWQPLTTKDAALLARLALEGPQTRSGPAAWLWPGVRLPRAHANLRQRLFRLRRLGGGLIDESGEGLGLAGAVQCDVWRDACSDDADFASALLSGVVDDDSAGLRGWIEETRSQWLARRADLMTGLAARHESTGALAAALALTERLLALEPLLEHAWRRLMRLHAQRGDRAAALAAFERCEQVLRDELGVKPAAETQALLHQLESATPPQPGAPASLPPPPLVGRVVERQAMAAAWQAGQAFVLVGEAGLGKSRLLSDLAVAGPARVLESARPGDEAVPYAALVRLLRRMQRVASRADALWPQGAARAELARLLPELGPAPAAPGLEALLHGAIESVFAAAPGAGVQAVLFDDLHHADPATRAVLRSVAATPGLRWGFASRPGAGGELVDWLASSARLQPVILAQLTPEDLHKLLLAWRLPGVQPALLAPALARHCGGNPLFVLETLKHLLHHGTGDALATGPLPLPASVEAVLAQRLARLGERAQAVARVAAVAGADFTVELAAAVLGSTTLGLADPWAELLAGQVLCDAPASAGSADVFAHEAVRDAVLRGLPQALRGPLHARIAAALAGQGAPPQRVARHHAAAGQPGLAAVQSLAAAAQALHLGRTAERLAHLRQAAAWFEQATETAAAFDAQVLSIEACLAHEGVAQALALAGALMPQAATRAQRRALRLAQAGVALAAYDVPLLLAAAAAARADATPGSDDALSARALLAAGQALGDDTEPALRAVKSLRTSLRRVRSPLRAADLWGHCAVVYNSAGRTADCMAALQHQHRLAQQAGHAEMQASALSSLSGQYTALGDGHRAITAGLEAVALHRRMGAEHAAVTTEINLVIAYIGGSRLRDARALLDSTVPALARSSADSDLRYLLADLSADIWLRCGQPQRALDELSAEPAAGLNLARRLNRCAMRATAAQMLGHGDEASALWHALRALVPSGPGTGLRLRARALASVVLAPAAARAELDAVVQQARDTQFPAGEALALMRRAAWALRSGDHRQARADALALVRLRPRALHLFVCEAELRALVCQVLAVTGPAAQARAQRKAALDWVAHQLLPQLPDGMQHSWRAHPAHQALWA